MGERGTNATLGPDRQASVRPDAVRRFLRNGLVGLVAIAVVVATHFVFPVTVMYLTAGLQLTLVGIGLFLLALLAVAVVPIAVTVFLLEVLKNRFYKNQEFVIDTWPWFFAIPSAAGLISLLFTPVWINGVPANHFLRNSISSFSNEFSSWIIAGLVVLVVFVEFGLGAVFKFESSNKPKTTSSSQTDQNIEIGKSTQRFRASQNEASRTGRFNEETTYYWQQPPAFGFESVGGFDEVKDELYRRVIEPHSSDKESYHRFRVSPPTGILLYGPPGTGKTYLARAIAGELGSPYVELSQADLTSMWINESPAKVRRLFEEAERFDFSVVFIDEIDGLVQTRTANAHNEDSKVVSEFLARLAAENPNYLIIAATNRPDQLDDAVLRPGRFDEQFEIGLPDVRERIEIFKVQLRGRNPSLSDSDYQVIGERTEGFTAADITSVVDRAALYAAERDAESITLDDLLNGFP